MSPWSPCTSRPAAWPLAPGSRRVATGWRARSSGGTARSICCSMHPRSRFGISRWSFRRPRRGTRPPSRSRCSICARGRRFGTRRAGSSRRSRRRGLSSCPAGRSRCSSSRPALPRIGRSWRPRRGRRCRPGNGSTGVRPSPIAGRGASTATARRDGAPRVVPPRSRWCRRSRRRTSPWSPRASRSSARCASPARSVSGAWPSALAPSPRASSSAATRAAMDPTCSRTTASRGPTCW